MTSGNGAQAMDDELRTTDMPPQKLILGTAAFGSDYGIKHDGQPSISEIEKIARAAWDAGIRVIHTSWQYGMTEEANNIFDDFDMILKDHTTPQLFTWGNEIGFSVYDERDLSSEHNTHIIPVNVLDNRYLNFAKSAKGTIIARSVFLQGLLLIEKWPSWISTSAMLAMHDFRVMCNRKGWKYYEAALGWVLGLDDIDRVIVGVNSAEQLEQLVKVKPLKWDYDFSIQDEMVLDPRRWPLAETNKCIKDEDLKRNVESSTAIEGVHLKL